MNIANIENVQIEDFEEMPKEQTVFFSAVCLNTGLWCGGPSASTKELLVNLLSSWKGCKEIRIFSVRLPIH